MSQRHNVFLSFHHANDQGYKTLFERIFASHADVIVSRSVDPGDIDPLNKTETVRAAIRNRFISNTSVTIVLIGAETWQRKHVDWEIGYSLTQSSQNARSGVLGILLPSYPRASNGGFYPRTVPPRLYDNLTGGYATLHGWSNNPVEVQGWVHDAFTRRSTHQPNNGRVYFANNRTGSEWS